MGFIYIAYKLLFVMFLFHKIYEKSCVKNIRQKFSSFYKKAREIERQKESERGREKESV